MKITLYINGYLKFMGVNLTLTPHLRNLVDETVYMNEFD